MPDGELQRAGREDSNLKISGSEGTEYSQDRIGGRSQRKFAVIMIACAGGKAEKGSVFPPAFLCLRGEKSPVILGKVWRRPETAPETEQREEFE